MKSIALPEEVLAAREERHQQLMRSSRRGVFVRLLIIVAELGGVALFNSSALLLDALSSLLDVAGSLFLMFCIRLAKKPPDEDHPFGHGRYEPLGGLQLGLLMVLLGGGMLLQQLMQSVSETVEHVIDPRAWLIALGAVVLLEISYRFMMRAAKNQHSPALAADAVHYRIDALNSLFATGALFLAYLFPKWGHLFDHGGAMVISLLMIVVGLNAARGNLHQLLDRIPDPALFARVRKAALRVSGVHQTEKLQIQQYGPDAHVDIDIEVDPTLSVEVAHRLTQLVRIEIQKEWPAVQDVVVHVEPHYPEVPSCF